MKEDNHQIDDNLDIWKRRRITKSEQRKLIVLLSNVTVVDIFLPSFSSDHQRKEKALKVLRQKALDKNPNEFYFHMINSKVRDGRHYEKNKEYTPEQLKLIKSQDAKYIAYKRKIELEKIEKLKSSLHLISVPEKAKNTKIVFVDSDDEEEREETVQRVIEDGEYEFELLAGLNKHQQKAYKELKKREERARQLTEILNEMTGQGGSSKDDNQDIDEDDELFDDDEEQEKPQKTKKKKASKIVWPQERKK